MAETSVGAAVGEGFAIIKREPLSVVVWGIVQVAVVGVVFALLGPMYLNLFGAIAQSGGAPPDPRMLQPEIMQMQGVSWLADIIALAANSVLYCAVFRAVLHPDGERYGYLRVGAAELYLFALILGGMFALGIGMVVAMIPLVIVIGVLTALHAVAGAAIVGVIGFIGLFGAMIYVLLRLAFVGPMMVDAGRFDLVAAWALTRGQAGSLFLIALTLLAIAIGLEIVIGLVMVILFAVLGAGIIGAGGAGAMAAFFHQPPQDLLSRLAPLLGLGVLIWIPVGGAFLAVFGAPWARAYLDMKPSSRVAATFA